MRRVGTHATLWGNQCARAACRRESESPAGRRDAMDRDSGTRRQRRRAPIIEENTDRRVVGSSVVEEGTTDRRCDRPPGLRHACFEDTGQ